MNWPKLADLVNDNSGAQLLEIGFQMEEVGSRIVYYERALIQGAVFCENLFILRLGWQALFCPFSNNWLWIAPPNPNGNPVQIIDYDVSGKQPIGEENQALKGLIKIAHYSFSGALSLEEIDPASLTREAKVVYKSEPHMAINHLETGKWIIPSDHPDFLLDASRIKAPK